jgi:hypothetical protein
VANAQYVPRGRAAPTPSRGPILLSRLHKSARSPHLSGWCLDSMSWSRRSGPTIPTRTRG